MKRKQLTELDLSVLNARKRYLDVRDVELCLLIINANADITDLKMPPTAAVKMRIMPEGIDSDLEAIKVEGKKRLEAKGGVLVRYEEEEIAFGLKALIAFLAWPEGQDTEMLEEIFGKIPQVSSVEMIDYRRAIG